MAPYFRNFNQNLIVFSRIFRLKIFNDFFFNFSYCSRLEYYIRKGGIENSI
jgi:hypothetical protein